MFRKKVSLGTPPKSKYELFLDQIKAGIERRKETLSKEIRDRRKKEKLEEAKLIREIKMIDVQSKSAIVSSSAAVVTAVCTVISLLSAISPLAGETFKSFGIYARNQGRLCTLLLPAPQPQGLLLG